MPKKKKTDWKDLIQSVAPEGHRWKDFWHLLVIITSYLLTDRFKSSRRWLVYTMHYANWIDLRITPYSTITDESIAAAFDNNINERIDHEDIYKMFGTNRNTYKKNFANYLQIPDNLKIGQLFLILLNHWQDSNGRLKRPVAKKDIVKLPGLYHKKVAIMFKEIPQVKNYFNSSGLTYEDVKLFPPRLVETFFVEIGEPERFKELVKIIEISEEE